MSKQTDFFEKYGDDALTSQKLYGVPASITLAQAALESNWGNSGLTREANNFFGIKASTDWKGEYVTKSTKEEVNGQLITINSKFRKYSTPEDGFEDHALFLKKYSRYKSLFLLPVTDYKAWANGLKSAGYATDSGYAGKLIQLIETYKLYEYDTKPYIGTKK